MFKKIKTLIENYFKRSYGSELEQYIISRGPKNAGDVERMTLEYNARTNKQIPYL
jgi:hypothetical protein